jgi:hypothetical protein
MSLAREQVAAEGGQGEAGDDYDPGGEEEGSGVEEKRIGCHENSSDGAKLAQALSGPSRAKPRGLIGSVVARLESRALPGSFVKRNPWCSFVKRNAGASKAIVPGRAGLHACAAACGPGGSPQSLSASIAGLESGAGTSDCECGCGPR